MPRDVGQNRTQTKGPGGCPWPRALARFSTQQAPYDDGLCYRSPQPQTWKTHTATRARPVINVPRHVDALPGASPGWRSLVGEHGRAARRPALGRL